MDDPIIEEAIRRATQIEFAPHAFAGKGGTVSLGSLSDLADEAIETLITEKDIESFLDRMECLPGLNIDSYLDNIVDNFELFFDG